MHVVLILLCTLLNIRPFLIAAHFDWLFFLFFFSFFFGGGGEQKVCTHGRVFATLRHSADSSVVRAPDSWSKQTDRQTDRHPDSWSKGRGFESLQERQEKIFMC